jgi:hypothetical protein
MAFCTLGTIDVYTWRADILKASAEGVAALYRDGVQFSSHGNLFNAQVFSHPPSMIHVLQAWHLLEIHGHLPLQFWMRFSCALADALSLLVVWKIGKQNPSLRIAPAGLALLAACPLSLMISGFHGNTDPIMILFVLASVYFIERRCWAVAGAFFGLAMCIKIVPVILLIAFVLYLPTWNSRFRFAVLSLSVFVAAGMPFWIADFSAIVHALAHYNGDPWLTSRVLAYAGVSAAMHKAVFFALLAALSVAMNIRRRIPLFAQVGAIFAVFLAFAPGFSVQYFAWEVPWILFAGTGATLAYYVVPGAFLARLYTVWCGGLPWYAADQAHAKMGYALGLLFVAAWITIYALAAIYPVKVFRLVTSNTQPGSIRQPPLL